MITIQFGTKVSHRISFRGTVNLTGLTMQLIELLIENALETLKKHPTSSERILTKIKL